jgi:hypothetical protein
MSAVQMGYLEDEFVGCFLPAGRGGAGERRMPIINRGLYSLSVGFPAFLQRRVPDEEREMCP